MVVKLTFLLMIAINLVGQEPTSTIPDHLQRAIVFMQRDFHNAAQNMYLKQLKMNATPEGIAYINAQEEAKDKAKNMENYQQQARDYCKASGLVYSADQIICVKAPSVLGDK